MVRVVRFNKGKFDTAIKKYSMDKNIDNAKIAENAKINESTIYNMIGSGRAFKSSVDALKKIGVDMDSCNVKPVK